MVGTSLGQINVTLTANISQFTRQLATANRQLSNFGKTTGQLTKGGAGLGQLQTQMGETSKGWASGMSSMQNVTGIAMGNIVAMIAQKGVQMIKQAFEYIINTFKAYEQAILNASISTGLLGSAATEMSKKLGEFSTKVGKKTIYTGTEVATVLDMIADAGYNITNMAESNLIPILNYATATQSDLKAATQAVLTVLKQFNLGIEESAKVVDIWTSLIVMGWTSMDKLKQGFESVGQISGVLGQDVRGISAALAVLNEYGYGGAEAGSALQIMFTKLLKPSKETNETLAELGLTLGDISPTTHSLVDILYTLRDANFSVASSSEMFRAKNAASVAVLVEHADEVEKYILLSKEMYGITAEVADVQETSLNSSLKRLTASFEEVANSIGESLAPVLKGLAAFITNVVGPAIKWLGDNLIWISPILWGIGKIFGWFGEMEDFKKQMQNIAAASKTIFEANAEGKVLIDEYIKSIDDYSTSWDKVIEIKTKMLDLESKGLENTKEYIDLTVELINANNSLADSESDVLTYSSQIVNALTSTSTNISTAIGYYRKLEQIEGELSIEDQRRNKLIEEKIGLDKELITTANQYGTASREYNSVLSKVDANISDYNASIEKTSALDTERISYQTEYNNTLAKSSSIEIDSINLCKEIIDARGNLLEKTSEYNKQLNEYTRLTDVLNNYEKIHKELLKPILEIQDKLLEVELKRYKLTESRRTQLEGMFETLASEGMVNEEIISAYKDEQEAQGDVMKSRVGFSKVLGDLSSEDADAVTDWVEEYIASGGDINKANAKIGGTLSDITSISGEQLSIISKYGDASIAEVNAVESLRKVMVPFTGDLVENGLASNNAAEAWTKYTQSLNDEDTYITEAAGLEYELRDAMKAVIALEEDYQKALTPDFLDSMKESLNIANTEIDVYAAKLLELTSKDYIVNIIANIQTETFDEADKKSGGLLGYTQDVNARHGGGASFAGFIDWLTFWTSDYATGGIFNKPTLGVFGEAGAEAIIPLEGSNKKQGAKILNEIMPSFYPELMHQQGGVFGGTPSNYGSTDNSSSINLTGDIHITGVSDATDFVDKLLRELEIRSRGKMK
jgi:TP901 family phage tail tape measure protein